MDSLSLVEVVAPSLVVRHCHVRVLLHSILKVLDRRETRGVWGESDGVWGEGDGVWGEGVGGVWGEGDGVWGERCCVGGE